MSEPNHTEPLAFAVAVFYRWREQQRTAHARVPPPLRQIACRLLDFESLAVVARSLQIGTATLQRWRDRGDGQLFLEVAAEDSQAAPLTAFVPLPQAAEGVSVPTPSTPFATLVIERPDGVLLHLGGPIDVATVATLLGAGATR